MKRFYEMSLISQDTRIIQRFGEFLSKSQVVISVFSDELG